MTNNFSYGNILVDKKKQNKKGVKDYEIRLGDYRGEILKRGIEVNVVREATINKKGEIKKWIYY